MPSSIKQVDVTPFLSKSSAIWKPSAIRGLFPLEATPGSARLITIIHMHPFL